MAVQLAVKLSQGWTDDPRGCRWHAIEFPDGIPVGRWIALRYRTNVIDELERPVLCLSGPDWIVKRPMPAALFGTGEWVGFIPKATSSVSLSTTTKPGHWKPIDLLSCRSLGIIEVFRLGLSRDALSTAIAAAVFISHGRTAARQQLTDAIGSTALRHYHAWRVRGTRSPDPLGLDHACPEWADGPHIHVVLQRANAGSVTLAALQAQTYPHWSVSPIDDANQTLMPLLAERKDSDIVVSLFDGDQLPSQAFAALAVYGLVHPEIELMYADEDTRDAAGRFCRPKLKPDWSPVFHQGRFYAGDALYFRVGALRRQPGLRARDLLEPLSLWSTIAAQPTTRVGHIRRVLLTTSIGSAKHRPSSIRPKPPPTHLPDAAQATVIIPSRDRPELIDACLSSLARTAPGMPEIIVIDNGSQEPQTRATYQRAMNDPRLRLRVIDAPGPFNFSRLCNQAATEATGRTLVFLNNDTVVTRPDWLGSLLRWTTQQDVGAVGARLLYPSGRLQHAGLVTGLRGYASHIELNARGDDPGYLDALTVAREVSAVTGACLAVEKTKFESVGGFDAEHFPIELGDVDLCLRLGAAGYRTILATDAVLTHHESATRGRPKAFEVRYQGEKDHFASFWSRAIRDDPYYHPALSVTSVRTRLDQ